MADADGCLLRRLHPHHRAAPQAPPAPRSGSGWQAAGDIYLGALRRLVRGSRRGLLRRGRTDDAAGRHPRRARPARRWNGCASPRYFFRLVRLAGPAAALLRRAPGFHRAAGRAATRCSSFVRGGLHDLSISRTSFNWGIPVPGDPAHVMYVWLDALTNYITACGFPDEAAPRWALLAGRSALRRQGHRRASTPSTGPPS